jgi:hypothetical protein
MYRLGIEIANIMVNMPNSFGEWLKDPGAKTIGGNGKNKYRQGFLRRLLREHFRNDENYFVKPAQWKNVNPKGAPDLRNNKHDAAPYVRMRFALEYVLRSHNSGNSQLGILALHLVKEVAKPLSASRRTEAPFGEMPQTMSFTDVLGAGAAIG